MEALLKPALKYLSEFSPFALMLAGVVYIYPKDPYLLDYQAFYAMQFFCIALAMQVAVKLESYTVFFALAYFLCRAAFAWQANMAVPWWAVGETARSTLWLILLGSVLLNLSRSQRQAMRNMLAVLCLVASVVMIYRRATGYQSAFFINNTAADASTIAVLFPLLAMRPWWVVNRSRGLSLLVYGLPVAAVIISGSSTAAVALAVCILCYTVQLKNSFIHPANYKKFLLGACISVAVVIGGLYAFSPDTPMGDSGRFRIWKFAYQFVYKEMPHEALRSFQTKSRVATLEWLDRTANPVTGVGPGTFKYLYEEIETANGQPETAIFSFVHNDWIQTFFHSGWIGAFLLLLVGLAATWKALARPWLSTSLLTYGVVMLAQYLMSYPSTIIIGLFLLIDAFRGQNAIE